MSSKKIITKKTIKSSLPLKKTAAPKKIEKPSKAPGVPNACGNPKCKCRKIDNTTDLLSIITSQIPKVSKEESEKDLKCKYASSLFYPQEFEDCEKVFFLDIADWFTELIKQDSLFGEMRELIVAAKQHNHVNVIYMESLVKTLMSQPKYYNLLPADIVNAVNQTKLNKIIGVGCFWGMNCPEYHQVIKWIVGEKKATPQTEKEAQPKEEKAVEYGVISLSNDILIKAINVFKTCQPQVKEPIENVFFVNACELIKDVEYESNLTNHCLYVAKYKASSWEEVCAYVYAYIYDAIHRNKFDEYMPSNLIQFINSHDTKDKCFIIHHNWVTDSATPTSFIVKAKAQKVEKASTAPVTVLEEYNVLKGIIRKQNYVTWNLGAFNFITAKEFQCRISGLSADMQKRLIELYSITPHFPQIGKEERTSKQKVIQWFSDAANVNAFFNAPWATDPKQGLADALKKTGQHVLIMHGNTIVFNTLTDQ